MTAASTVSTGRRPVGTDAAFEAAYTDLAGRVDRLAPVVTPGPVSRPGKGHDHA